MNMKAMQVIKAHYTVLKPFFQRVKKYICSLAILIAINWIILKIANFYFHNLGMGKDIFIADPGQDGSDLITGRTVDIFGLAYANALLTVISIPIIIYTFFCIVAYVIKKITQVVEWYSKAYKKALQKETGITKP